jgi:hypothetical protein
MAELIVTLVVGKNQPTNLDELKKVPASEPLYQWGADDWTGMRQSLVSLRKSLLRRHANFSMKEVEDAAVADDNVGAENNEENAELASGTKAFNEKFYKTLKNLDLHAAIAPFRQTIEEILKSDMTDQEKFEPLQVPKKVLNKFK